MSNPSSPTAAYTTCTGTSCVGRQFPGRPLRCPSCGSTLVLYHRPVAAAPARAPMSQVEQEARAIARAREERVHIRAPVRPGVFTTVSKSDPSQRHTLVAGAGIEACSCKGYEYRRCCKHVEALRNRLAREARRAPVAA